MSNIIDYFVDTRKQWKGRHRHGKPTRYQFDSKLKRARYFKRSHLKMSEDARLAFPKAHPSARSRLSNKRS